MCIRPCVTILQVFAWKIISSHSVVVMSSEKTQAGKKQAIRKKMRIESKCAWLCFGLIFRRDRLRGKVRTHDNHLFSNRVFAAFHRRAVSDLLDKNDSHSLTRLLVFTFHIFYTISSTLLLLLLLLLLLPSRISIPEKFFFIALAINYCDYR